MKTPVSLKARAWIWLGITAIATILVLFDTENVRLIVGAWGTLIISNIYIAADYINELIRGDIA